jgi:hypothetical protein
MSQWLGCSNSKAAEHERRLCLVPIRAIFSDGLGLELGFVPALPFQAAERKFAMGGGMRRWNDGWRDDGRRNGTWNDGSRNVRSCGGSHQPDGLVHPVCPLGDMSFSAPH